MQREIKFRAFDKRDKMMHKVSSIDFENKKIFIYDKNGFDKNLSFDEIELRQFTGLHDKNGKEIYEGDVIPIFGKNHAVKFKDGMFTINDREMRRYIHSIPLEVIGNVYENPELVK